MTEEEKKQDFEDTKKTVEAHGTISEDAAEKEAEKTEEVTEKLIEKKEEPKQEEPKAEEKKEVPRKRWGRQRRDPKEIRAELISAWEPKTKLGREVKDNKITNIDQILDDKRKILEDELVDTLLDLKFDLITIGQAKGKFGGGKRRAWRQTQKKTQEGNVPTFSALAVVGDENGHVGIGSGKAKETLPARDKAIRKAKLNVIKIKRTCAAFDCACSELHTIPFKITGKSGSVRVTLIPAPQGTGLVVARELKKVLKFAGIKDVYSRTFGRKRTTFNLIKAGFNALKKTNPGVDKK